jgi:putative Mn2+ efflux pump MntP
MGVPDVVGELVTLTIMAFALGMDAFSVGLGMGMVPLRLRQIFNIGITIGIFHMIMPLLGILVGKFLSSFFGDIAAYIGGGLLVLLGIQMIISSFCPEESFPITPVGTGLLLFALGVSLDSFSAGLSLGLYGARTIVAILLFGIFSMGLTWAGLLLGRKLQNVVGTYGEALGGSILFTFGLKLVLQV